MFDSTQLRPFIDHSIENCKSPQNLSTRPRRLDPGVKVPSPQTARCLPFSRRRRGPESTAQQKMGSWVFVLIPATNPLWALG